MQIALDSSSESMSVITVPPLLHSSTCTLTHVAGAACAWADPQATSETSQPATQLRRAICKSPAALGALGAFLEAAADEAAQLAASLQAAMDKAAAVAAATGAASQASALTSAAATAVGTPAAAGGGPGSGTSSGAMSRSGSVGWMTATSLVPPIGRALRMAELARVERLMADVAALMLNVLDAKDLAAMATVGRSLSGSRGGRSFGNASGTNLAAIDALFASAAAAAPGAAVSASGTQGEAAAAAAAAAASMQHLGPVTRQLLPAVAAMGRWWRARSSWCTGEGGLQRKDRWGSVSFRKKCEHMPDKMHLVVMISSPVQVCLCSSAMRCTPRMAHHSCADWQCHMLLLACCWAVHQQQVMRTWHSRNAPLSCWRGHV